MPNFNYKRTLIVCIILFLFGVIFGFIMFPKILRMGLQKVSASRGQLWLTWSSDSLCHSPAIRVDAQDADSRHVDHNSVCTGL